MTEVRDWQKDKAICTQSKVNGFSDGLSFLPILPDIGLYWLQQYANMKDSKQTYRKVAQKYSRKYRAEKVRADKAESLTEAFKAVAEAAGKELVEAEEREQKLKEAMEIAIRDGGKYENPYESLVYLQSFLSSLYPLDKEEETK